MSIILYIYLMRKLAVSALPVLLCIHASAQLKIAAFGDYSESIYTQAVSNLVTSLNPDIIITAGDNNYGAADYEDNVAQYYGTFIGGYAGQFPSGPPATQNRFFPALGNHDWDDAGVSAYQSFFTLPGISNSSSGNERYYDFVYGSVHFFCLNSYPGEPDGRNSTSIQAQWLQAQLAASTSCWKIVYMHLPPYSSGTRHGSETSMRWPFENWGASAVISGHEHLYERVHRDDNNDGKTLMYFTSGVGGRSLYGFSNNPVSGSQVRHGINYGTMLILATETTLRFEFWSILNGGTLIDSITITNTGSQCGAPCNDGIPCTLDEEINGQCSHTPIVCNDNNPCTSDACVQGQCNFPPVCNDGDICTTDNCSNGQCSYTPIANCNCPLRISSLTLVNSATDNDIRELNSSDTINLAVTPSISIRANPCQMPVGSVKFTVNGNNYRTESSAPFSVAGDASGNYNNWNVSPGLYTITATPYSGSGGSGTAGTGKTITLRVINQLNLCSNDAACNDNNICTLDKCSSGQCFNTVVPGCCQTNANCNDGNGCTLDECVGNECLHTATTECCQSNSDCNDNNPCTTDACSQGSCTNTAAPRIISSFTLVNSATDTDIGNLENSDVINLSSTPNVNVRANLCSAAGTGSVRFKLNGSTFRTENSAPFTLAGDNNGNYNKWNVQPGSYALEATPYSGANGGGTVGTGKTITITVSNGSAKGFEENPAPQKNEVILSAHPNPFRDELEIAFMLPFDSYARLETFNITGQRLATLYEGNAKASEPNNVKYLPAETSNGIIIIRMESQQGVYYQKAVMMK